MVHSVVEYDRGCKSGGMEKIVADGCLCADECSGHTKVPSTGIFRERCQIDVEKVAKQKLGDESSSIE